MNQRIKKMDKKKKQGKKVLYLKDGRRRQLDLHHLLRAGFLLKFVDSGLCKEQELDQVQYQEYGEEQELKLFLQAGRASEASHHLPSKCTLIYELDGVAQLITDPPPNNSTSQ